MQTYRTLIVSLVFAVTPLFTAPPLGAEPLTIDAIFGDPDLSGATPRGLRFSPDGTRVTYLRGKDNDSLQQDLWEYHIRERENRLLVDSKLLYPQEEVLDEVEKLRRERARIGGRGIVEYQWDEEGRQLLFPLGGDLYLYDLTQKTAQATRRLTQDDSFETDARFSPQGNYVSFIKDQDIHLIDLGSGTQRQLTEDGEGPIKNGMAEFIAQEEMGRRTGYWWSPDEKYLAFTRVDETPVEESRRYAIHANDYEVVQERYPSAGTPNVLIQLGVMELASGKITWIDLGQETDIYLNRVNWLPDSSALTFQWQPRNQQALELRLADIKTGTSRLLLRETSSTWVALHDDLYFLKDQAQFIWASARSGYKHLYLYDLEGQLLRQLTEGDWVVRGLQAVDEKRGQIYFTGFATDPLAQHLYRTRLDGKGRGPEQITQAEGYHNINMAKDASSYIDTFSTPDTPPQTSLHRADGKRLTWLLENALDDQHPYGAFRDLHVASEFGSIHAEDGQPLYYRILKPYNFDPAKRYPVIVYLYAGPGVQLVTKSWGGNNGLFLQFLQQQGYIVFSIDNRGSANRGTAFEAPIYRQLSLVEVRDQKAGVDFLKSLPYVDGNRVGVMGGSYGGYMSLMALLQAPETFQVGIAWAPVTDWAIYDTHYTERFMGTPQNNPEGYAAANVLNYTQNLEGKLLVMHGLADDNVLPNHSTALFAKLQQEERQFDSILYPGQTHGIRDKNLNRHRHKTMLRYFDLHLKAEAESAH